MKNRYPIPAPEGPSIASFLPCAPRGRRPVSENWQIKSNARPSRNDGAGERTGVARTVRGCLLSDSERLLGAIFDYKAQINLPSSLSLSRLRNESKKKQRVERRAAGKGTHRSNLDVRYVIVELFRRILLRTSRDLKRCLSVGNLVASKGGKDEMMLAYS